MFGNRENYWKEGMLLYTVQYTLYSMQWEVMLILLQKNVWKKAKGMHDNRMKAVECVVFGLFSLVFQFQLQWR